jgi:hypothetical protein
MNYMNHLMDYSVDYSMVCHHFNTSATNLREHGTGDLDREIPTKDVG